MPRLDEEKCFFNVQFRGMPHLVNPAIFCEFVRGLNEAGPRKNEPRRGMGARRRGSGHGYYFLLRKLCGRETEKLLEHARFLFQAARRSTTAARALAKELVPLDGASVLAGPLAAFGILGRLQVTHINFIFLLFAHITFLSCVFGFGLCQSRRIVGVRQRPFRLGSGRPNGSAYLSNASAVELHALQNLRPSFPSTNSQPAY